MPEIKPRKHGFTAADVEPYSGSGYPVPFKEIAKGRSTACVGDHVGLSQYGVNIVNLPPGRWSAQRHWHEKEDEFVYMISGEVVLITDDGVETITAGMMMGWPANVANGHHLINKSDDVAIYMEVGSRAKNEVGHYPDIDLHVEVNGDNYQFSHKDGTPY